MPIAEYDTLDAIGLAKLVERGAIGPAELLEEAIARIERTHPQLNAVVDRQYARARAAVARGLPAGPLRGVPLLVKEDLPIAGMRLSFGSVLLRDHVARETHAVARRLRASGLVCVGRTNMSELGLLPTTEPALFGPTRNPWSLERSPGGSSGGSAAAVAARVVPLAHGSDGGGSIRIPASHCGLVGLKPSRARTPDSPARDPLGTITELCLTRSVRDTALVLDLLSVPDPPERVLLPAPPRPYRELVERDPGRLRIAFTTTSFSGRRAHPDCVAAVEAAARLCAELGHEVEEAEPRIDGRRFNDAFLVLWAMAAGYCARAVLERLVQDGFPRRAVGLCERRLGFEALLRVTAWRLGAAPLEPFTRRLIDIDRRHTPGDLWLANQALRDAEHALTSFLGEHDLLLTPTMGEPPWRVGELDLTASDAVLRDRLFHYVAFTPLANTTGLPAVSLPLHWSAEGLPIGVQFIAPYGREDRLLGLAGALERARPWSGRRPPVG